jgi:uncharacterized membrane protein
MACARPPCYALRVRFAPLAILAAAAGWLTLRWDALPERWVIHWGPRGVPDGYASKTFGGVFGPLLFGVALALCLELVAVLIERASRTRLPRLARAYGDLVRWVSMGQSGAVAVIAILLPSSTPPSPRLLIGLSLGALAVALVAGGLGLSAAARRMAAEGHPLPKGYGPFLYRDPEDPRLIVPKLVGIGWTFNFARPSAWLLLGLLLLPVLVALVAVFLATG